MIHIKQAIVVEGKYDKIKLSSIVDAVILVTNGFQIYKNPEQLDLIRYYARTTGVILMTDADRAGFQIRNYLKGAIQQGTVYQVYTPDVYGKEHRKEKGAAQAHRLQGGQTRRGGHPERIAAGSPRTGWSSGGRSRSKSSGRTDYRL